MSQFIWHMALVGLLALSSPVVLGSAPGGRAEGEIFLRSLADFESQQHGVKAAYQLDLIAGDGKPPRLDVSACATRNHWLEDESDGREKKSQRVAAFLRPGFGSPSLDGEPGSRVPLYPSVFYPSPLHASCEAADSEGDCDEPVALLSPVRHPSGPSQEGFRSMIAGGKLPLPLPDSKSRLSTVMLLLTAEVDSSSPWFLDLILDGDGDEDLDGPCSLFSTTAASTFPRCGDAESAEIGPCVKEGDERYGLDAGASARGETNSRRRHRILHVPLRITSSARSDNEESGPSVLLERSSSVAAIPPLLLEQHLSSAAKARHTNRQLLKRSPFLVGAAAVKAVHEQDKKKEAASVATAPLVAATKKEEKPPSVPLRDHGEFVPSKRLIESGLYSPENNPCHPQVGRLVMCVKAHGGSAASCKEEQRQYMKCQRKKALGTESFAKAMGEGDGDREGKKDNDQGKEDDVEDEILKLTSEAGADGNDETKKKQAEAGKGSRFAVAGSKQEQEQGQRGSSKAKTKSLVGTRVAASAELGILQDASDRLGMPLQELEAMCSSLGAGDCPVATASLGANPVPGGASTMPGMGGVGPLGPDLSSAAGLVIGAIIQGIVGPLITEMAQNFVQKMMTVIPPVMKMTMIDGSDPATSLPAFPPVPNPADLIAQAKAAADAAMAMAKAQLDQAMAAVQMAKDQANDAIARAKAAAEEMKAMLEQVKAMAAEKLAEAKALAEQAKEEAMAAAKAAKAAAEQSLAEAKQAAVQAMADAKAGLEGSKDALAQAKANMDQSVAELAKTNSAILNSRPQDLLTGDAAAAFSSKMSAFSAIVKDVSSMVGKAGLAEAFGDVAAKVASTSLAELRKDAAASKASAEASKAAAEKAKPASMQTIVVPGMSPITELAKQGRRPDDPIVLTDLLNNQLPAIRARNEASMNAAKKKLEEVQQAKAATLSAIAAVRAADEQQRRAKEEAEAIKAVLKEENVLSNDRWARVQKQEDEMRRWRVKVQEEEQREKEEAESRIWQQQEQQPAAALLEVSAKAGAEAEAGVSAATGGGGGKGGGGGAKKGRKGQLAVILHNDLSHSLTTMLTRSLTESFSDYLIPSLHDSIEPVLRRELTEALPPRLESTLHTVMTRGIVDSIPPLIMRTLPTFVSAATTDVLIRSLTESISRVVVAAVSEALLFPPEIVQCCEDCKLTGAQAACACCDAAPADWAAASLNLQGTIAAHYSYYYGNYTASVVEGEYEAAIKTIMKGGADDKGKKKK